MESEEREVATAGTELVIDPAEVGINDHERVKHGEESGNGRNGPVLTAYNVMGDPEVLVIPNFVNEAEIEHLLELAKDGWEPSEVGSGVYRSKNEGKDLENQVSKIRTSYSCLIEPNYTPMVAAIENRLAALADIDVKFLEPLNMVRYAPGQFFKEHHDGRFRPITVFVYLNDIPPGEGGETYFRELNMKVVPRRGCAVMWTNIVGPQQEDHRMVHQGLPPAFATKYGVNSFFNDKPMRRFVFEGDSEPSRPTCQTNTTILDPVEIASRYPAKVKHSGPGLCFQRLRISQEPAIWMVPNVVTSKEAGQLMDLMDKQQGRVPPNGWRTSATAEDLQQLLMDLEARLATAAGCGDQSPLGDLELRRLPPEATRGASVVSQPKVVGDCRAVYLFLHDIADDCAGEVFFPNANLQAFIRRDGGRREGVQFAVPGTMLDSLYGNLLGGEVPADKQKGEGDDIFAEPKAAAVADKGNDKKPDTEKTFSAAKLMMPPVRKKVEPVRKPSMPALDLSKLAAEKEALMKQRAAAETSRATQASASSGSMPNSARTPETDGSVPATISEPIAANLFGDPNEEYDPAKPNDYDEFCRRRMRQKAEEEMEKRRQDALARQQQASKPAAPKEEDFATKMMKKMGWKEGGGLGKEGQGIANPLVMQKTDQKTGRIVEGSSKREAPSPPAGQPDQKQAKAAPTLPPTRVLLLNNMVGAGDVDEDLEEETAEEASKYGKLKKCVIKELSGKPDDEAVRIFLEYQDVASATKAFADLNGRYFGGRTVRARFFDEKLFAEGQFEAG